MVHHPIPPRSREVRVNELGNEIVMRIVALLDEAASPSTLRKLISGDQLAVSEDGLASTHIVTFRRGAEIVIHSKLGYMEPRFMRQRPQEGTRILRVGYHSCLVWGKVDGYPPGLWTLEEGKAKFIAPLEKISRLSDPRGLIYGTNSDQPGQRFYLTSWDALVPVQEQALVTAHEEGLCVVEQLACETYGYELRRDGEISPFRRLALTDAEHPVGIVPWRDRLMLAVRRGSQSWLIELNSRAQGEVLARLQIDGDLLGVWASPNGATLALLVHPRGTPEDILRLELSDSKVVYEGRFQMDPMSIVWSPTENALAMKIREGEGVDRVLDERIVGMGVDYRIAAGHHLREFLVDDRGRLAATIQNDGVYDQPVIGGHAGTKVPLAWNLHYDQEGAVAWTTVHADRILTWSQRPTIQLLAGRAMRSSSG